MFKLASVYQTGGDRQFVSLSLASSDIMVSTAPSDVVQLGRPPPAWELPPLT